MSNKMLISQLFFDITINYHLLQYNFEYPLNKNENKCFYFIFLAGDFMSYVDQFGDFMSRDFMSGDFLTWIRGTYITFLVENHCGIIINMRY